MASAKNLLFANFKFPYVKSLLGTGKKNYSIVCRSSFYCFLYAGSLKNLRTIFCLFFLLLFIYLSIVIFHCFFVFVFFVHLSFDSRGISKLSLKKVVLAVETIRLNNLFLLSRRFCKTLKKKQYVLFLNYYFGSNQ